MGEVVTDQRRRLAVISHEPGFECLNVVVGADRAAGCQRLARAGFDTLGQNGVVDLELDDAIELLTFNFQEVIEGLRLRSVRGKPSRMKPLAQSGSEIRSEMMPITMASETRSAGRHHFFGFETNRCAGLNGGAQHISRRELGDAAFLADDLRLCAFAGPWRPEKNEVHRRPLGDDAPRSFAFLIKPSYCWAIKWLWTWATVSMVTLTAMSSDVPPK